MIRPTTAWPNRETSMHRWGPTRPMRRWGIQKKVFILSMVPTMVLMVIVGVYFTHSWISNLTQLLEDRGQSLSRQLASASEYGAFTGNRNLLFGVASSLLEEQDVRTITIYDRDGNELVHTGPRHSITRPEQVQGVDSTHVHRGENASLFLSPIYSQDLMIDGLLDLPDMAPSDDVRGDEPLGWASVELSHAATQREQYKALLISLLLIGGGLIVNALIALYLSRSVTNPIYELTHAIGQLTEGKLNTRVTTQAGPELEALANGLNTMAGNLQQAQDEMQQNVDQATEDLRETLETIEIQNIELDMARKQALEASRIKSEFLANMSHEIRTPLNGIIGFTDLLLKAPASAQQKDHLSTIRKSSEILLTIINDILDFSKIEAGKLVLDQAPLQIRDTIEEVMVMLAPTAHDKNLDLAPLVYDDVPDAIVGDALRIKQVITNLVNNAIKFTQTGEVVLRAMLDDEDEEGSCRLRISVTDTGVGLSRAQQQSLFHAFNQADASTARQYGGTGLGLVISRRLVEEMGGEIGVESELGKGSTFWFTLQAETTASPNPPPSRQGLRKERALYLEYQPTGGQAVENLLRWWEMEVVRVDTPASALEAVRDAQADQSGFAVVLVGISRHLLQSQQYRELLKQLEYECDCRVLLLTPTLKEENHTIVDLASAHLTKPVRRSRLYQKLFQLIHGSIPEAEDEAADKGPAPALTGPGETPTVLAVDDNEANLKLILTLLEDFNINVQGASNGYEALKLVQQQRFDLIFMDVQMPGMDGTETTNRIRRLDDSRARIPVIALTAHALTEEREKLLGAGFDGYLTKPINHQVIAQTIRRHTGYAVEEPEHRSEIDEPAQAVRRSARSRQQAIVDVEASVRLAGGKTDLAEELLSMLLDHVTNDARVIEKSRSKGEFDALLERVHKLHGATRYCGVPELRHCAHQLEAALKQGERDIDELTDALLDAIDRFRHWCNRTDWQQLFRSDVSGDDSPAQ